LSKPWKPEELIEAIETGLAKAVWKDEVWVMTVSTTQPRSRTHTCINTFVSTSNFANLQYRKKCSLHLIFYAN
jgi:hypothetical protein